MTARNDDAAREPLSAEDRADMRRWLTRGLDHIDGREAGALFDRYDAEHATQAATIARLEGELATERDASATMARYDAAKCADILRDLDAARAELAKLARELADDVVEVEVADRLTAERDAARAELAEHKRLREEAGRGLLQAIDERDRAVLDAQAARRERDEACGLTLRFCQERQPWTVPYALGVSRVADIHINQGAVPHILASHCVMHAAKSVGKLAAVFEALDHPDPTREHLWTGEPSLLGAAAPNDDQLATIRAMSADLVTAALRFANLYSFDLETALDERVRAKNGSGYTELLAPTPSAPSERKAVVSTRLCPGCSRLDGEHNFGPTCTIECDEPEAPSEREAAGELPTAPGTRVVVGRPRISPSAWSGQRGAIDGVVFHGALGKHAMVQLDSGSRLCFFLSELSPESPPSAPPPADPRAVEAAEDAPLDVAKLADYWDARRKALGKPDASACAAELRRALADSRNTWLKLEAIAKSALILNERIEEADHGE